MVTSSWVTPTSLVTGALAVSACAFLAAVYLTGDARRGEHPELVGYFHRRALISGIVTGALSILGLVVAHTDAPTLADDLSHRGLPYAIVAIAAGCASLILIAARRYFPARAGAAIAVAAVLFAWGIGRYPELLPGLTASAAQALPATLRATAIVALAGVVILLPSMLYLFVLFQRTRPDPSAGPTAGPVAESSAPSATAET